MTPPNAAPPPTGYSTHAPDQPTICPAPRVSRAAVPLVYSCERDLSAALPDAPPAPDFVASSPESNASAVKEREPQLRRAWSSDRPLALKTEEVRCTQALEC